MRQNTWTWAALLLLAVLALLYFLNSAFPGTLNDENNQMRLVWGLLWLTAIGGSVIVGWRGRAGLALKQALAWVAIAMVLVVIYNIKEELMGVGGGFGQKVVSSLTPTKPQVTGEGTVLLTRDMRSHHFIVDAVADGHVMRFLIDTGASDVALTPDDARRLGYDLSRLNYSRTYETANGPIQAAPVTIPTITVGNITVHDVRGSVMQAEGGISLLGMSFLNALGSYEFRGERMILKR